MKSKIYPVKVGDEIRDVTVPGSGGEEPAPETEQEFETFLAEAVEAYAESSDMRRPDVSTFAEAGLLTMNRGVVVRIGGAEFQVTVVRSR